MVAGSEPAAVEDGAVEGVEEEGVGAETGEGGAGKKLPRGHTRVTADKLTDIGRESRIRLRADCHLMPLTSFTSSLSVPTKGKNINVRDLVFSCTPVAAAHSALLPYPAPHQQSKKLQGFLHVVPLPHLLVP